MPQPRILVVDIGGSHVKCLASGHMKARKFDSWPDMTPAQMVERVGALVEGWEFDVVSIGYPGAVAGNRVTREPHNLGHGWRGFDFAAAFGKPVKVINDSAMQAYGAYRGGKMLFLGLGTGLGSALIADDVIVPLELAHLPYKEHETYEDRVGKRGLETLGEKKWRREVCAVIELFRRALLPDYIVLGGGNAVRLEELPDEVSRVSNSAAFEGGFRLWPQHAADVPRVAAAR